MKRGYTLTEALVVMALILVLATLMIYPLTQRHWRKWFGAEQGKGPERQQLRDIDEFKPVFINGVIVRKDNGDIVTVEDWKNGWRPKK